MKCQALFSCENENRMLSTTIWNDALRIKRLGSGLIHYLIIPRSISVNGLQLPLTCLFSLFTEYTK